MKQPPYNFKFHHAWLDAMNDMDMTVAEKSEMLDAIVAYARYGKVPSGNDIRPEYHPLFAKICRQVDEDRRSAARNA